MTYGFCAYHEIECDYKGSCINCPHNTVEDTEWFRQDEERMTSFYQCNPELFRSCKKTYCGKECTLTTVEKYAQRDEFGRAIVVCIDDLFEPAEEQERSDKE